MDVWRQIPTDTHDATIASLLRQNDVAVPFEWNNDVILMSCVRWDTAFCALYTTTQSSTVQLDVISYPYRS